MVIHRSKFPKHIEHIARGRVTSSSENRFQVRRTKDEKDELTGEIRKIHVLQVFRKKEYNVFQKPYVHTEVMLRYRDSKSRNLEYNEPERNLPFEVRSLRGELFYREDFD